MTHIDSAKKYNFTESREIHNDGWVPAYSTKGLKNVEDFFGNGKVDLKDGVNAKEAEYIITELEDEDIISKNDLKITDKEIKKFLKSKGQDGNKTAVKNFKKILGLITKEYADTRDGKIGTTMQSAMTGDCWLLSGVNSLSYSDEGKKVIKNALEYKDGKTIVHFKGADVDIEVSDKELYSTENNPRIRRAGGDDDMIIFEIAFEKLREKIANCDIVLSDDAPAYMFESEYVSDVMNEENDWGGTKSALTGGEEAEIIYYLTGKESEYTDEKENAAEILDKFSADKNKNYTMNCNTKSYRTIKDVNNKSIELPGPHAYAVKSADKKTVTITDPHNSGKYIVLSKKTFFEAFDSFSGCDLSIKGSGKNFIQKTKKETQKNADGTKTETVMTNDGRIIMKRTFDTNGKESLREEYKDEKLSKSTEYNIKTGKKKTCTEYEYDDEGKKESVRKTSYDKKGNETKKEHKSYDYDENDLLEKTRRDISYTDKNKTNLVIRKEYDENRNATAKTITYLDKEGAKTKVETDSNNDGIIDKTEYYKHKEDGSFYIEVDEDNDGTIDYKRE